LDKEESPAQLGRLRYTTVKGAITRFRGIFQDRHLNLNEEISRNLLELEQQALRRCDRRHQSLDEVTVRWNQRCILDCFQVSLGLRERIFFTFDISENSTWASKSITFIVMSAVIVSIFTFIIETIPDSSNKFGGLRWVDAACVFIYTVDYIARLITVPFARLALLNGDFLEDVIVGRQNRDLFTRQQRLREFLVSPMGIVDLLSVAPFWVALGVGGIDGSTEEAELRLFGIVRIIRVFKLATLTRTDLGGNRNVVLNLFKQVMLKAWAAMQLVVVLVLLAMLFFGTLIWVTERGELFSEGSPDCPLEELCSGSSIRLRKLPNGSYETKASPFESIPMSFWWVIVTITTVGYGDYAPVTAPGYFIGSVTILYGVVVFALPVGVIGTTFSKAYDNFLNEQTLRKQHEADEETSSVCSPKNSEKIVQFPPLVHNFIETVQQNEAALNLPFGITQRWEESLKNIVVFENILVEHPCETLEKWGAPLMATLSQLARSQPLTLSFYNQTRAAWHRLLLHTAEVFAEFPPSEDHNVFNKAMCSSL